MGRFCCCFTKAFLALLAGKLMIIGNLSSYESIQVFTPLGYAIDKGNIEVVKLLLDKGADIEKECVST